MPGPQSYPFLQVDSLKVLFPFLQRPVLSQMVKVLLLPVCKLVNFPSVSQIWGASLTFAS